MPNRVSLPTDANNKPIALPPAKTALAVTVDSTISASTEITLNSSTTFLRLYAQTQDVFLKWGTSDVTSSNFDEIIPAGQIVDLIVPAQSTSPTGALYTAINLIERSASASIVVIEK